MANSRVLLAINASDLNYANKLFKQINVLNFFDIGYSINGKAPASFYISTIQFSIDVDSLIQNNPDLFIKVVGYTGAIDLDSITKELGISRIYSKR